MSDEPIETECPTCGYLCEHDGKEYTPVRIFTDAVTPNWDALTAKQIAAVIESAPVVLGEWERNGSGEYYERHRAPSWVFGSHSLADKVFALCPDPGRSWSWCVRDNGLVVGGHAPTRKAAMEAADAAARERGWRLMGGE